MQMRAAAEDFTMARLVGVRANRVIAVAFAISGVLASIVSLYLVTQTGSVSYKMGVSMVLIAFVASVIGGMGSLAGAALGGFLVGIVSVSLQAYLPVEMRPYRDAFVFLLFIAFLLWRPAGAAGPPRRPGAGLAMALAHSPASRSRCRPRALLLVLLAVVVAGQPLHARRPCSAPWSRR